jgi:hypothetical protein
MYQPISINTIRQALSWSPVPPPISIRMVGAYKWPDGTTSGEYVLRWEGATIRELSEVWDLYEGSETDLWTKEQINQAFCTDITVVRSWVDAQHDKYCVELYGRVTQHSAEYQLPLLDDEEV